MLSNSMFTHLLVEDGAAADAGALEQFFTIHDNTKYVVAMAILQDGWSFKKDSYWSSARVYKFKIR